MYNRPKIKLCGMTRPEDIEAVNDILPDYIGFIFWDKSFRCLTKEKAKELKSMLDSSIKAVGVFVDEKEEIVADLVNDNVIDAVQLHGSESEEYIYNLRKMISPETLIIKAFKADSVSNVKLAESSSADMLIFDPGKGEGMTFNWNILKDFKRPYFLAGGLNADNVSDAISILSPYGVDVSSGIETDKLKDINKMTSFVNNVKFSKKEEL